DRSLSVLLHDVPVPAEVAALPNVAGAGTLRDLRQSMALDTSGKLKELVQAFAQTDDADARQSLLSEIIYRWAGADALDPHIRGPHADARHAAVVEQFSG